MEILLKLFVNFEFYNPNELWFFNNKFDSIKDDEMFYNYLEP
jgi:hypothetical protein